MPNNSTYLDELALLNQQNFLGGAATYGKAIKEKNQNETLVDLYNKFKADKNELQTTMEQTGDFNKYLTTAKVGEGEEKLPPEAGMYIDFIKTADQYGAYVNLYQPFITAFATLGDEGVKIASTLSDELANQLTTVGKKEEAVFKQLQLKHLNLTYEWDRAQYNKFLSDTKFADDSMRAASFISKTNAFSEMLPDTVDYNDKKLLNQYMIAEKTAIEEAKALAKSQGIEVSDDAFLAGLKLAKDWSGKGFKYINDPSKYGILGGGQNPFSSMEIQYMLGEMQSASWRWNGLSPDFKKKFSTFLENPFDEKLRTELMGETPQIVGKTADESFAEIYNMFKPGGQYSKYYSIAKAMIPGFDDMSMQDIGKPSAYKSSGEEEFPTPKMNMPKQYPEIIRMNDPNSFQTQNFKWNQQWLKNYANSLQEEALKRQNEINFFDTVIGEATRGKRTVQDDLEMFKKENVDRGY